MNFKASSVKIFQCAYGNKLPETEVHLQIFYDEYPNIQSTNTTQSEFEPFAGPNKNCIEIYIYIFFIICVN